MAGFIARVITWFRRLFAASPAPASPIPPHSTRPVPPPLSPYRAKLQSLWVRMEIDDDRLAEVFQAARQIMLNRERYQKVESAIAVPWYVIGLLHMREPKPPFSFQCHLANGDPLFDRFGYPLKTTHVPVGLGPFHNWEESAIAACKRVGWGTDVYHWDLINALENIEAYNGPGYYLRGINSPYCWAGTNQAQPGKFVGDGVFDPHAVDRQLGCAPVLLALKTQHGVDLNEVLRAIHA